ncbi:hypothetical protein B9Z55_007629 [Caenorhabditis nigoni]|uniref:Uncharacterized protein n=1 Tax=Caenorhabditis nigoni TaxID=1611254 RepID=A0A2G5VAG6_9PELO|nr:hypothetical protein B9Z55_007629 [Caenorhabditis nigoni]
MRENQPLSIETFNLSSDELLHIAQNQNRALEKRVQNLGKVNKKSKTSVEWLKADYRTRSHGQRCYKDRETVPTTLNFEGVLKLDFDGFLVNFVS